MDISNYTIEEHAHRFAVWTAARAASRSRLKNTEVEYLINQSDLRNAVEKLRQQPLLTDAEYRKWIKEIGTKICTLVKEKNWSVFKTDTFHFGLAAKIISIYIKTVEVLPTKGESQLAKIAYPPIDGILLKNINKKYHLNLKVNWSTFNWDQYEHVINTLNELYPSEPKWKIETEWCVSIEEDETESDHSTPHEITNIKIPLMWNGYCPESWLQEKKVRMKLNSNDFYESEATGLQICVLKRAQAIIMNFRGKGDFRTNDEYADVIQSGEMLSPQTMDSGPFNEGKIFNDSEAVKEYINTIK